MTEKRKVRTVVRDGAEMRDFEYLEDALEFLDVSLSEDLARVVDETVAPSSTVLVLEHDGQIHPDIRRQFKTYPRVHQLALFASSFAILNTFASRDPILIVNTGTAFLMVATTATLLTPFLAARYKQPVPVDPPPTNPSERWVVSIASKGELCRAQIGMGIKPGTPQA